MTPRTLVTAGFAALLAATLALDLLARRPGARLRPLGATLAAGLRAPVARLVALAVWLWLGWHFLAR